MNEQYQRMFLLYYSGLTIKQIADQLEVSPSQVSYTLAHHGTTWVTYFLKPEYKLRLVSLAAQGLNGQDIADQMGVPWNRWLVVWTLRRIQSSNKIALIKTKSNLTLQEHTFRCPICTKSFKSDLLEITSNPDRLCTNCNDRRKGERRVSNRTTKPITELPQRDRRSDIRPRKNGISQDQIGWE